MKKLFTFLFALIVGVGTICASDTQVDGIYYDFNNATQTATVTYRGASSGTYHEEYSGAVTIPSSVSYDGITYSVTSIGEYAFYKCYSLTSVTIPNSVTSIGDKAFWGCSSLKSVTIPNSVTSIGWGAFYGCTKLTSVTIGDGVTSIGECAFDGCSSLTSVTIPNNVTSIGDCAFRKCSSLTSINVDAYNSKYSSADGVLFNKDKTTLIAYPGGKQGAYTIPNSVTSIGYEAFCNCSSLTSVTIPNSVTSIGYGAFLGCSSLTSVTIPNSVTTIGEYAFYKCSSLTSITIPNSVKTIGEYAFYECYSLASITIPNSVTSIGNGAFRECSSLTSITIPNGVKSIRYETFSGCSSLKSVIIPNSVTAIGIYAFKNCSKLASVTIGNSVTSIEYEAFSGCFSITSVTLTAASEKEFCKGQGNHLLKLQGVDCQRKIQINGTEVTDFIIPNSVTSIGDDAFYNCSSLISVHISDIAAWCQIYFYTQSSNPLYYAKNLYLNGELVTDLVIPNSVTSIGNYTFEYCTSLTSVTIGNSVTSIGNEAFYNCSSLTSLTIGNSVTSIGNEAFGYFNKLYNIYCYASTPPTAYQSAFANYNAFLHVPCDNQRMYLSDEVFGKFQCVVCIGAEEVMTDGVTVVPDKNDAVFTWPTEGSANSYTLEIKKDGIVFCTLTFNANGQLTGIAFMPSPDGSTPAKAATSVGAGYQFTVTGLDGASHYTYELTTKDAANQVIASYTGEFSTEGFTALEDAVIPSLRVVDGAVVCDEPYTIYDISGRDVTNQNGNLQGVYIVRTAKRAVKVVF